VQKLPPHGQAFGHPAGRLIGVPAKALGSCQGCLACPASTPKMATPRIATSPAFFRAARRPPFPVPSDYVRGRMFQISKTKRCFYFFWRKWLMA